MQINRIPKNLFICNLFIAKFNKLHVWMEPYLWLFFLMYWYLFSEILVFQIIIVVLCIFMLSDIFKKMKHTKWVRKFHGIFSISAKRLKNILNEWFISINPWNGLFIILWPAVKHRWWKNVLFSLPILYNQCLIL